MKKILSTVLVVVLLVCLSTTAFATGNFTPSAETKEAPELVKDVPVTDANGNTVDQALISLTPLADEDELPAEQKEVFDEAKKNIEETQELAKLTDDVAEKAGDKELAVSDFFNFQCADENASFPLKVTAEPAILPLAIVQYIDGAWVDVPFTVDEEKGTVTYEAQGNGPIVFLCDKANVVSPATGEHIALAPLAGAVVMACAAVWFFYKSRKVEA